MLRYNAKALVNKGNCMFMRGEFEHARSMYQEAMGAEVKLGCHFARHYKYHNA